MGLLKAGLILAVPTALRLLSGLLVIKTIAIYLGADGLGRVGQFMSLIAIVTILAGGGISNGIAKYVSEHKVNIAQFNDYVRVASFFAVSTSTILCFVLVLFAQEISYYLFRSRDFSTVIQILGVTQFAIAYSTLLTGILVGLGEIRKLAAVNLVSVFLGATGVIVGAKTWGFVGALCGLVWSATCQLLAVGLCYKCWHISSPITLRPLWKSNVALNYAKFGLMQIVTVVTMQASQLFVRGIVEQNASWQEVGYYQGMLRVSDAYLQFFTVVFSSYYLPRLATISDRQLLFAEVVSVYKMVVPILLTILPLVIYFRFEVIRLLFSTNFYPMAEMFVWQLTGDFFKVVAYIVCFVTIAKASTGLYVIAELFQATMLVTLATLCVNNFGWIGAAYSYCATYVLYAFFCLFGFWIYIKKRHLVV